MPDKVELICWNDDARSSVDLRVKVDGCEEQTLTVISTGDGWQVEGDFDEQIVQAATAWATENVNRFD